MSQQGQFQRRPDTMFNDFRYPMPQTREPVDGAKFPARWVWDFGLDGKVKFKVNDGIFGQQDKNSKLKEVELGAMDRNSILNLIMNAIEDPNFTKAQYHVKKKVFGQGGRMNDQPSTLGTFTIIRTSEGKIAVGYTKGTYKVMFEFNGPNDSIVVLSKDGQSYEDHGLMSRVYAKAFVEFSRKFLDQFEWDNFKPRERKENNGGGNRGGGNNNWGNRNGGNGGGGNNNYNGGGNGGGGNRQAPADFDDDIDF